jgi:cell division septum initiation protein DivIVA
MIEKLDILESKIGKLINIVEFLRKENKKLKEELTEKESIIDNYKRSSLEAIEKIDSLIEILKKEGVVEETG